jgi:hypothetical protein
MPERATVQAGALDLQNIDERFVRDMLDNPDDLAMLPCIFDLTAAFKR